jgi:hypothetical protein
VLDTIATVLHQGDTMSESPSALADRAGVIPLPSAALPQIARADIGAVIVAHWHVTPETQERLADAIIDAWNRVTWSDGLVSVTTLVSTDGEAVLQYAQWTSAAAYQAFEQRDGEAWASSLDHSAPRIERQPPVTYRLHRSGVRENAAAPGCIVVVTVEFDAPDERRQREWIDLVFDVLASETAPPAGGISGHFHVSLDGTRVMNYAEWVDEAAHREALEGSGQGAVGRSPRWREVQTFPGMRSGGFRRYRLHRSLVAHAVRSKARGA